MGLASIASIEFSKMTYYRSQLEIAMDILELICGQRNGILPTHIMHRCNLSYGDLKRHLTALLLRSYIGKEDKLYVPTESGYEIMHHWRIVKDGIMKEIQIARSRGIENR